MSMIYWYIKKSKWLKKFHSIKQVHVEKSVVKMLVELD